MNDSPIFHLAIPIKDVEVAKEFYAQGLGCQIGRANSLAVIFNFFGHQLVAHLTHQEIPPQQGIYPRHFGLVFQQESDWLTLWERVQEKGLAIYQPARVRFPDQLTEHSTFFLVDPFENLLEFKYYHHPEAIFGAKESNVIGDST
jgi:extradiol dioxygenase family protein